MKKVPERSNASKETVRWERVPSAVHPSSPKDYKERFAEVTAELVAEYCSSDDESSTASSSFSDPITIPQVRPLERETSVEINQRCETVEQEDFLLNCIIGGKDALSFVHFFDDSPKCDAVDSVMVEMEKTHPKIYFCRVETSEAPLVTKQMNVKSTPTVLAIQNRKVRNRLTHFGESEYFTIEGECRMLRAWMNKEISGK